jgi:hypothetical protein
VIDKQDFIREKARQNADDPEGSKILWSRHAIIGTVYKSNLEEWENDWRTRKS